MGFLKRWWKALLAAVITVGAMLAAQRATEAKEKAQKALQDGAEAEVSGHIESAKQALDNAQRYEDEAEQHKLAAREKLDRLAEKDESLSDIQHRWKRSNRMRNRNP